MEKEFLQPDSECKVGKVVQTSDAGGLEELCFIV
jgi:hypothetical protein